MRYDEGDYGSCSLDAVQMNRFLSSCVASDKIHCSRNNTVAKNSHPIIISSYQPTKLLLCLNTHWCSSFHSEIVCSHKFSERLAFHQKSSATEYPPLLSYGQYSDPSIISGSQRHVLLYAINTFIKQTLFRRLYVQIIKH